jgi:hypothetical protein
MMYGEILIQTKKMCTLTGIKRPEHEIEMSAGV